MHVPIPASLPGTHRKGWRQRGFSTYEGTVNLRFYSIPALMRGWRVLACRSSATFLAGSSMGVFRGGARCSLLS